jgi:hypothetical protein
MGTTNPCPPKRKLPNRLSKFFVSRFICDHFQPKMITGIHHLGGYRPTKNSQYPKDIHKKQKPNWGKERKKELNK